MTPDNFLNILQALTKEEGIILILIILLSLDKLKQWFDIIINARRRWLGIDRREANKNLEEYTIKVNKIHEILEIYRNSLNAARIGYYVFHNGGKDIRGIPFLKFSCINEAVALGIRPRLRIDRDLQVATMLCWTKSLTVGNPEIGATTNLTNGSIKDLLDEYNVSKYATMPIYEESLLSGFILVEWKLSKFVPDSEDETRENILQCSKMIEVNSIKDINHFLSY